MPTERISDSTEQEKLSEYLLNLLADESADISLKVCVIQRLYNYQEDHRVRTALWNIIQRNSKKQIKEDDLITINCLRSLYWRRQVDSNEEELQQLQSLRKCSSSSNELKQAVLTSLYMHIIRESEYYDMFEIYDCYMRNTGDICEKEEYQDDVAQKASDWIIYHRSILLPKFVQDLCECLDALQTDVFAYIYVGFLIGKEIKEDLCCAIRDCVCVINESCFRSSLFTAYETKFTKNNEYLIHYVQLYGYFHKFTYEYALMLLKLEENDFSELFRSISQYSIDREAVELFLNTITSTSSSHYERFHAAQILLKLEEAGCVSIIEVHETIMFAIDKYDSENKQGRYDLKKLLFQRILYDLHDPEEHPGLSKLPVASLTVTPCTAAPAIVFSSS